MAEEIGIVMSLYDRVSPTLKSIAGNTSAFDKALDELEANLKAYDKAQDSMVRHSTDLRKALAETDQKVKDAQKSYRKLKDEASKGALDAAIDEQERLKQELRDTESAIKANSDAYKDLYTQARKTAAGIRAEGEKSRQEQSAVQNRAAGSARMTTVDALIAGGIGDMAADAAMEIANAYVSSAYGQSAGGIVSSTLSGAASGAAIGTRINPGLGTAVGGLVGGAVGAVTGGSQVYASRDEAFGSYVQEAAEGQLAARDEAISSGSDIAANREQKQLAFSTLLGSENSAEEYLQDVQDMAAQTNYTYDEITGYAKSLVKPFGADRSLDVLTTLSDTSAALSLNESDNSVLIAGLSRMRLTDKTTQEYLNYFSERGIDVYEALSKWGDAATVAEKVTAGQISGIEAADALLSYMEEQYGGLSDRMAGTYQGMVDNLADAQANAEAAAGEGYNEKRKEGIQAQMDWLNSGAMEEANRAIGAWRAELENERERYEREAVDAVMASEEYRTAEAEGDAAEMGRLIMQAKVEGMNRYNASEGAQLALESELALAEGIRENTRTDDAYWDAGWRKGEQYSKGLAEGILSNPVVAGLAGLGESRSGVPSGGGATYTWDDITNAAKSFWDYVNTPGTELMERSRSNAYGLRRVPYDGSAALLHEGERVLTAREARAMDRGGAGNVTVKITGSWSVRSDADVDAVAEALYRRIRTARMGGVRT